jgi:DNA modification methylase
MLLTDIVNFLGKPYFQAPNCLIYQMDCLEVMLKLPGEFINLTVTSPPYNIGKEYEKILPHVKYPNQKKHGKICFRFAAYYHWI